MEREVKKKKNPTSGEMGEQENSLKQVGRNMPICVSSCSWVTTVGILLDILALIPDLAITTYMGYVSMNGSCIHGTHACVCLRIKCATICLLVGWELLRFY